MKSFDSTVRFMQQLAEVEEAWFRSEVLAAVDAAAHSTETISSSGRRTATQMDPRNALCGTKKPSAGLSAALAVTVKEGGSRPKRSTTTTTSAGTVSAQVAQKPQESVDKPSFSKILGARKRRRSGSLHLLGGGDPVNYPALFHFLKLAEQAAKADKTSLSTKSTAQKLQKDLDTNLDLELGEKSGVPIMSALDSAEMASCVATLHSQLDSATASSPNVSSDRTDQKSASDSHASSSASTPTTEAEDTPARFRELPPSSTENAVAAHIPPQALCGNTAFDRHFLCIQNFAATNPLGLSSCMLQVNPLNAPCGVREPLQFTSEAFSAPAGSRPDPETVRVLSDPMYQGALLLIHPLLPVSWWDNVRAALSAAMPNEPLVDPLRYGCIMCDALMSFGLDAAGWEGLKVKMARAIEADNWAASRNDRRLELTYGLVMHNWTAAVDLACMGLQGVQCLANAHKSLNGRLKTGDAWNQTGQKLNIRAATSSRAVLSAPGQLKFVAQANSADDVKEAVQWASWQMTQRLAAMYAICTTLQPAVSVAYSDGGVPATAALDVIHTRRRLVFESLKSSVLPLLSAACGGDESGCPPSGWAARQKLLRMQLEAAGGVWLGDGMTPSVLSMADGSELVYPGDLWLLLGVAQYGAGAWHRVLYDPVLGISWRPTNPLSAPPVGMKQSASTAESLISLGEPPRRGTATALVPLQSQGLLDCAYRSMPARVFACLWSNVASASEACLNVVSALTRSGSLSAASAVPPAVSAAGSAAAGTAAPHPAMLIPVAGVLARGSAAASAGSQSSAAPYSGMADIDAEFLSSAGPQPPTSSGAMIGASALSSTQARPVAHVISSARQSVAPTTAKQVPSIPLQDHWMVPHPQTTGWVTLKYAKTMLQERGEMLEQQLSSVVVQLQSHGVNTSDLALRPVPALFTPEHFPNYTEALRRKLATLPPAQKQQLLDAHDRMAKYRERLATVYTCSQDPIEYVNLLQQLWQNRVEQGKEQQNSQPQGTISAIDEVAKFKAAHANRR